MTVHTWPAARNPSTREEAEAAMASMAGGTRTWLTSIEKLVSPRSRAVRTAMALAGAVVSNPTPKKTTSRSGSDAAMSTASRGE